MVKELIIHKTNGDINLMIAEPFIHFEGDCDNCKYFDTIPITYPSGICVKYKWGCGYGFICKSYEKRSK